MKREASERNFRGFFYFLFEIKKHLATFVSYKKKNEQHFKQYLVVEQFTSNVVKRSAISIF